MICKNCGKEIFDNAAICPGCGCPTDNYASVANGAYNPNNYAPVANGAYYPNSGMMTTSPIVVRYLHEARTIYTLSLLSLIFFFLFLIGYIVFALIAKSKVNELPIVKESDLKTEQDVLDYQLAQSKLKTAKTLRRVGLGILIAVIALVIIAFLSSLAIV